jgi:hypothetical protein
MRWGSDFLLVGRPISERWMDMADPLFFRDVELLLIVFGGIFFGYLGYRLFIFGVMEGKSKFEAETQVVRLVFSGTAPGLFFMFAGASILVAALMVLATHTDSSQTTQSRAVLVPRQPVVASAIPMRKVSVSESTTTELTPTSSPDTTSSGYVVTETSKTSVTRTSTTKKH